MLCQKGKNTTRITAKRSLNLSILSKNSSWGFEGLCDAMREGVMHVHKSYESQCGLYQRTNKIARYNIRWYLH